MSLATRPDDGMFPICSSYTKKVNWRLRRGIREREFAALTDDEIARIEGIYAEMFSG
jgi:hypothetical protein